jgi:hypothetical protein
MTEANRLVLADEGFFYAFDILCHKTLVNPDTFRKWLGINDFIKIEKAFKVIFIP